MRNRIRARLNRDVDHIKRVEDGVDATGATLYDRAVEATYRGRWRPGETTLSYDTGERIERVDMVDLEAAAEDEVRPGDTLDIEGVGEARVTRASALNGADARTLYIRCEVSLEEVNQ